MDPSTNAPKPTGLKPFRADFRRAWVRITDRTSPAHTRLVLLLILFGSVLRIVRMREPLTYDEALTWTYHASRTVGFILSDYTVTSNHVLHSLLVKCSTAVFGVHLWSLRLPALLAGILVMPLFYVFVRAMFNRYIAVVALAFVAASGPLIEYSALARGYSLSWLFMVCALLAGRHFAKKDNGASLLLVAVFCALCLWSVPAASHAVVMVFCWLMLYLGSMYKRTLQRRMLRLVGAFVGCLLLALLFYSPLIGVHGLEHLLHHPSLGDTSWQKFVQSEQDEAFALWGYFNDTAATWISIAGIFGVVYAAYVSSKYRLLLLALFLSTVPLVLIQRVVAPPPVWTYVLFILHLGSAIAIFYALKAVQDRLLPTFNKRGRTAGAVIVVAAGMGWLGMTGAHEDLQRFPDAERAAAWAHHMVRPGDRVWAEFPWDAPLGFHLRCEHLAGALGGDPHAGGRVYVMVAPGSGQTLGTVLRSNGGLDTLAMPLHKVEDWRGLEIFAPR